MYTNLYPMLKKKILILFSILFISTNVIADQTIFDKPLQNIQSCDKVTLDGLWNIIIDPLENGYYNHRWEPKDNGYFMNQKMESPSDLIEYDFDTDYQIMVPGDWNTQMDKLYFYEGTVWYKRSFDYEVREGEKSYLYFGAINYQAIVYLNGKRLGEHIGGYTSFQFDVTGKLKEKDNFLVVKVDNKRLREAIPTINTDWWNYGGITRSVYIVNTPETHVYDYKIQLNPNDSKVIKGWAKVKNASAGQKVKVQIPELKISKEYELSDGYVEFSFKASPKYWSPDNPKLYEVLVSIDGNEVKDQIGFRTIKTDGSKILLNGKEIFMKGISIHEEAPFKTGRVTSVEEARILLQWTKELGANFVRLAHYPHNEEMVREAEKMGLLVWSEIPVYWTVLFDNPGTYANAENQLEEMIERDKNRAAVVLWSIANETPEGEARISFLKKLSEKARELDDSRLITAALDTQSRRVGESYIEDPLGEYVDVIGINSYCGWYSGTPESCKDIKWGSAYNKPVIMSEYGGGALQGMHGEPNERWTEEYQAAVYENNIAMLKNIDFLAGSSPWILMDFRSHRRHLRTIQADFNRKGLISEQGVKKKAFFVLQEYYNSIKN
tara:strand:+ start:19222 stop:21048 length:1827 start_codon:yes stop_codon:yes gene_type:complete